MKIWKSTGAKAQEPALGAPMISLRDVIADRCRLFQRFSVSDQIAKMRESAPCDHQILLLIKILMAANGIHSLASLSQVKQLNYLHCEVR